MWEEAVGRVNLQSQKRSGELLQAETRTGKNGRSTAEGSLGQEKTPKPVLPLCPGHVCPEAGPPSSCLTSSPFLSLDPPLGPSPLRWLLGSLKDPGQGRSGEEEQEAPSRGPGWMVG